MFAPRVRSPRADDAPRFMQPIAAKIRELMDEPPFGAASPRGRAGNAPAPRSVFVFHKSMPFKGHRAPVRASSFCFRA